MCVNIIQIMNAYECNGKNISMRQEMECSIQRGDSRVEWYIPSFTKNRRLFFKNSLLKDYNNKRCE
jgi:hypothetical protein